METDGSSALAIIPNEARLFGKMAQVMGKVSRVPKEGFNSFHKYKYATADDVADVIREAMSEVNLALIIRMGDIRQDIMETESDGKRKTMMRTTIHFDFIFACGDTGAVISSPWTGQVDDNSDKAITKCATLAEKYFLMKTFVMSAGNEPDPDADRQNEGTPRIVKWYENDKNVSYLSERAFTAGYITERNGKGRAELEAMIAPKTWADYGTGNDAWLDIRRAGEERKQQSITPPAELSAILSDDGTNRKADEPPIVEPEAVALLNGNTAPASNSPFTSDSVGDAIAAGTKAVADKLSVDKTKQTAMYIPPQTFANGFNPSQARQRKIAEDDRNI